MWAMVVLTSSMWWYFLDVVFSLPALYVYTFVRQEGEPAVGRLLVFSVEGQGAERKINLVAEVETRGAVYVLNGFNGKLLAGINSKVTCFSAASERANS